MVVPKPEIETEASSYFKLTNNSIPSVHSPSSANSLSLPRRSVTLAQNDIDHASSRNSKKKVLADVIGLDVVFRMYVQNLNN